MPDTERMTVDEQYKYLRAMQKRYRKASRVERSKAICALLTPHWYHPAG